MQRSIEAPEDIYCPITCQIMADPVFLVASGNTYECEAILQWLNKNSTDPLTGEKISDKTIIPNKMAKRLISTFLEKAPDLISEMYLPDALIQELIDSLEKNKIDIFMQTLAKDSRLLSKELKENKSLFILVCENGSLEILNIVLHKLSEKILSLPCVEADKGLSLFLMISRRLGIEGARALAKAFQWKEENLHTALDTSVKENDLVIARVCLTLGAIPTFKMLNGSSSFKQTEMIKLSQRFGFFQQADKPSLSGHADIVCCLEKLSNGDLASSSWDKTIKIWRAEQCVMTLAAHTRYVTCLQQMQDNFLASGSSDKTIKLWDLKTGHCIDTLLGHSGTIRCLQRLGPAYLASGSSDTTIKLWDLDRKKCIQTLQGHTDSVNALTLCSDNQLASGSWDNCIKIWDVQTGTCTQTLKEHEGVVRCLLYLPNGRLISGSRDKTIKIWDIAKGMCLATLTGHTDSVNCLYLLDDRYLCSGAWDKTIRVWDLLTNTLVNTFEGHGGAVNSFALGEDGILLSSSDDKTIKSWPIVTLLPREKIYSLCEY